MSEAEICPQCRLLLTGYASRLVQDACGHKKCRKCLLSDENKCKSCENNNSVNSKSLLEQQLTKDSTCLKQNINVIRYFQSVPKSPEQYLENTDVVLDIKVEGSETQNTNGVTLKTPKLEPKRQANSKKCNECGQEFRRNSHLEWHMRRHTGERPFSCPQCPKTFTQKSKLNRHLLSHTGVRDFKCTVCEKGFSTNGVLKNHLRIHTGEKPFACSKCSAKFTELSNLNKHMTMHSKERPFMCSECGARFSLKWRLAVHLRTHKTLRPYTCNECSRGFNNIKDLNRHQAIHTDHKPFQCQICNTLFRRKDNLERHIKNTHPENYKPKIQQVHQVQQAQQQKTEPMERNDKTEMSDEIQQTVITSNSNYVAPPANAVSVINGPVKLICKTKDFKDNYNITREEPSEIIENVDIYKKILSDEPKPEIIENIYKKILLPMDADRYDPFSPALNKEPPDLIKGLQPLTVPRIHYETSFENGPHAIIKNIKFKLPADYTPTLTKFRQQRDAKLEEENERKYRELMPMRFTQGLVDRQNCVRTITKTPVVETGPAEIHWRKRTTQIYVPDQSV